MASPFTESEIKEIPGIQGGIDNPFVGLGVSPALAARLPPRGITVPTPIQRRVIPRLAAGETVVFQSTTGSGKTLAYLLPLLTRLLAAPPVPAPRLLALAPTCELCAQIKAEADRLLDGAPLGTALAMGGGGLARQIDRLRARPAVVVGTPGRAALLARMGKLDLRRLAALVLDEGDRLVAPELIDETRALIPFLPGPLQAAACSATMPPRARESLTAFTGPGAGVEELSSEETVRENVEHWALFAESREKIPCLRSLIAVVGRPGRRGLRPGFKALIFTARGAQVGRVVAQLQYHHLPAAGLWSGMDRRIRKDALDRFRDGASPLLVTSDLAARGLDIPGVSHVVALDTADDRDAYLHRAGRTARAGRRGIMVTIGDEIELRRLARIEKRLRIVVYPRMLYGGRILEPPQPGEAGAGAGVGVEKKS